VILTEAVEVTETESLLPCLVAVVALAVYVPAGTVTVQDPDIEPFVAMVHV
jgi:hypothetical protein